MNVPFLHFSMFSEENEKMSMTQQMRTRNWVFFAMCALERKSREVGFAEYCSIVQVCFVWRVVQLGFICDIIVESRDREEPSPPPTTLDNVLIFVFADAFAEFSVSRDAWKRTRWIRCRLLATLPAVLASLWTTWWTPPALWWRASACWRYSVWTSRGQSSSRKPIIGISWTRTGWPPKNWIGFQEKEFFVRFEVIVCLCEVTRFHNPTEEKSSCGQLDCLFLKTLVQLNQVARSWEVELRASRHRSCVHYFVFFWIFPCGILDQTSPWCVSTKILLYCLHCQGKIVHRCLSTIFFKIFLNPEFLIVICFLLAALSKRFCFLSLLHGRRERGRGEAERHGKWQPRVIPWRFSPAQSPPPQTRNSDCQAGQVERRWKFFNPICK